MAKILSFEINNNIKIIEASIKGEVLSVLRCMCIDCVYVKDGKIIDMDGTVNEINEELKSKGIKTKKAIFLINSNSIVIRTIKLPFLKKSSEILSMLQIELQQTVSIDLSKYKILYEVSSITNENKIPYAVYIVYCVPEILISQFIELAAKLKLKLLKIDIIPNCINALYKNNFKINGGVLNNNETAAFVNVSENFVSFLAANHGICDFYISSYFKEIFIEMAAESLSQYRYLSSATADNLFAAQITKFMRYYYSVSGNRSIDKIYIYGCNHKIKEEINNKLNINSEIITNISNLSDTVLPDSFDLSKYFNTVSSLFSRDKGLIINTRKLKLKNNYGYAAVLLIISAASAISFGFFNSRVAIRNELSAMSSYIEDGKNNEIYNAIEEIKNETDYLKLYLQQAEMLLMTIKDNDCVDTIILREINRVKPSGTKITSIYSDRDSTQLECVSSSMGEVTLFFSDLKGINPVESAYIPAIQSKTGESFSYSLVLKLKDVCNREK
jgi:Tfp pilus assembly PilM family ATPase